MGPTHMLSESTAGFWIVFSINSYYLWLEYALIAYYATETLN